MRASLQTLKSIAPFVFLCWTVFLFCVSGLDLSKINNVMTVHVTRVTCVKTEMEFEMEQLKLIFKEVEKYFAPWVSIEFALRIHFLIDPSMCRMTYDIAYNLVKHRVRSSSSLQLIVAEAIEEELITGFACPRQGYAFISADHSPQQSMIFTIAHEIGHVLSLRHPFEFKHSESERADFMSNCPVGSQYENLMDYLPAGCGRPRSFNETQLQSMRSSIIRRKALVAIIFPSSMIGIALCLYEAVKGPCCRRKMGHKRRKLIDVQDLV